MQFTREALTKVLVVERIKGTPFALVVSDRSSLLLRLTLMAIPCPSGNPTDFIFGMYSECSMYAALQPVPKMTAILVFGST